MVNLSRKLDLRRIGILAMRLNWRKIKYHPSAFPVLMREPNYMTLSASEGYHYNFGNLVAIVAG